MEPIALSVEKFIAEQQAITQKKVPAARLKESASVPVITVCSEPGSGGRLIADEIAKRLTFHSSSTRIFSLRWPIPPPWKASPWTP